MPGVGQTGQDGKLDSNALLDAALRIVAEEGLGGLTLRPLARSLGCSVATLARQIGTKDALIDHIVGLASRANEEELGPWLRLVESFETLPRESLIDISEEILRLQTGPGRLRSHFQCELIQAAAFNPRLRSALAAWTAIDHRFWEALASRCAEPVSFDMPEALHAFAIDDAARALSLDEFDAYRWMRREGLKRLWFGLFDGGPAAPNALFERAISTTPSPNGLRFWTARELKSERECNFGAIIAGIVFDSGTDAITHREVARRAGMPHTSVAYHYPLQDDLMELGMNAIIDMVRAGSLAAMGGRELPKEAGKLAYASFAIALASARRPNLRPIAREMRRRRGESLLPWLRRNAPGHKGIDISNVQAMSSALIGAILLSRAGVRNSASLTRQFFAQIGDWPDLLVRFRA